MPQTLTLVHENGHILVKLYAASPPLGPTTVWRFRNVAAFLRQNPGSLLQQLSPSDITAYRIDCKKLRHDLRILQAQTRRRGA